jgi:hypothetical protein
VKTDGKEKSQLAEISDSIGNRRQIESSNSIPVGSLVGQNEPPVAIDSYTKSSKPIGANNKWPLNGRIFWSRNRLYVGCRYSLEDKGPAAEQGSRDFRVKP